MALISWQMGASRVAELLYGRTARLYPNTPEAAIANREAKFARGLATGLHVQRLTAIVDSLSLAPREELLLAPVSSSQDSFSYGPGTSCSTPKAAFWF